MSSIIFDFDGTIADTFGLIVDVSYELTGAPRLPTDQIEPLKSLPILVAIRRLGGGFWHIPKLMMLTRRRMRGRMAEVPVFTGVPELLAALHGSGHRLFILSSNNTSNVSVFLQTHKLESYFEAVYTVPYGNAWFKARALRKIMRQLRFRPQICYYVGNEVLDIDAAHEAGIPCIAVTWGYHNSEVLGRHEPDYLIDAPAELLKIFHD